MTLSWIKSMAKMISFLNLALFSNFLISFSLQAQTLISLDASGRSGENGSVEHDYSTRRGSASGRGRSGNSASPSTPGQSGGLIDVLMKDLSPDGSIEPQKVFISISGTVGPGLVDQKLEYMPSSQFILFDVHGGRGGNGGQGGDGEGGCNGRDGRDATRSFSGENGTDGCPGGDGGSGTPGSDGGAGGKIRIHMDQKDTHLLMLVKTDISGGPPGDPGKNGRPGEGGRGGQGGSSYSWTTTRVVGKRCDPDRMVNNGNGSRTVQKGACHDVTTTDRHTQSGGFDGRNGADGVIKSGPVNGGTQGLDGQFQITIHQEAGPSQTFTRPYNLVLRSFTMEDENHDGIFEPGEKVFVSGIKVQNIGEIPTPKGKSDVLIFLGSSAWIIADPHMLKAPQIEAGKEYT
ncbi:MAG: hypothetical protein KDD35_11495, partial [Bdellovibrionales bacterium]|nr:hypothetical protein [Bdellovibrionales bacterium]